MSEFIILYTHQKTKKRKAWKDGTLTVSKDGKTGTLKDDERKSIDSIRIKQEVKVGDDLETARYLIQVDDVFTSSNGHDTQTMLQQNNSDTDAEIVNKRRKFDNGPPQARKNNNSNIGIKKRKKFCIPRRTGVSSFRTIKCFDSEMGHEDRTEDEEFSNMTCVVVKQDQNGIWHTVEHNQPSNNKSKPKLSKKHPMGSGTSNTNDRKCHETNSEIPLKQPIRSTREILEIIKHAKNKGNLPQGKNDESKENLHPGEDSQTKKKDPAQKLRDPIVASNRSSSIRKNFTINKGEDFAPDFSLI